MTTPTNLLAALERDFAEQLAGIEFPEAPVAPDTKRNREATPVPVWPGNHEGSEI